MSAAAPRPGLVGTPEKEFLIDFVERNQGGLATLNDSLFYFGELGMQEHRSAELMCDLLDEHGFDVERGVSGFPTGFVATFGSGRPVIAIHTEYDANPANSQQPGCTTKRAIVPGAPGHCEGHNTNGAVLVLTAIGLRHAIERFELGGTLKIIGAPSEETLISRPYYVRDGLFDDVDVAYHDHIYHEFRADYGHIQYAAVSADFTFRGEAAHAAIAPDSARDALDAVMLMDAGAAQYREHMEREMSAQRVVTAGGHQPNVIPDVASVWWYFRHPSAAGAQRLFERFVDIARGAALMTDTEVEVEVRTAVWPVVLNPTAAEVMQQHIEAIGMPAWTPEEQEFARALQAAAGVEASGLEETVPEITGPAQLIAASSDSGDVSWVVPMARVMFPANVPHVAFHHWAAGAALTTSIAHKGATAGAKALGTAVLEYLCDRTDLVERTRASFERQRGDVVYRCLLPDGQRPPVNLNQDEMASYRSLMEPHYVEHRPLITS